MKLRPSSGSLVPLDQALGGESADRAGHSARARQHPLGEIGHPQPPVGVGDECDQHSVVEQCQVVGVLEPPVQLVTHRAVGAQKAAPDPELVVGERVWFRRLASSRAHA